MEKLYLISGDDEYAKSEALEKIKSKFNKLEKGLNFLQFDKDNLQGLGAELTTYSFFQEDKLIIVKVPPSSKKTTDDEDSETNIKKQNDWYTEDLEEKILNKIENITLVFFEEGTSKGKLYKFISANGKVVLCEKQKPQELANWALNYCSENNFNISKQDAVYLTDNCGNNKQLIFNELNKLFDYVDNKNITTQDIDKMCIRTPETIIFTLTDSMGAKNYKKSLETLEELLDNKEPIQKILVMITRHFKALLLAKVCLEQNKSIEKELGVKSYPAMKYGQQARNFTLNELIHIFEELARLDLNSKIGNIDIMIGLQSILLA